MDLKSRLNLLTDKHLGGSPDAWDDAETILEKALDSRRKDTRLDGLLRQSLLNQLDSLVKSGYGKTRQLNQDLAWRCLSCNTVSGLHRGSYKPEGIRKTCAKCAKPRKNPLTVAQELAIEVLIETEEITYEDAKARVTVNQ